ncbi:Rho termination factor N-terminal domain-containing protein [Hujiaoplasma nucleasis]|uniref:Rho termination factor N-terminal domain-containing protein n=1 Tax=Hujiaoplasma nucleasis TaxID=2725268 RepID=UPI0035E3E405
MVKVSNAPEKKEVKEETKEAVKETVKDNDKELQAKLESHTVVELREMAKEHDLSGYSSLRKAELIELIKTAL